VHISACPGGLSLFEGQRVEFERVIGPDGRSKAVRVRAIEPDAR